MGAIVLGDPCSGDSPVPDQAQVVLQTSGANTHRWGSNYGSAEPSTGGNPWSAANYYCNHASGLDLQNKARALGFTSYDFFDRYDTIVPGHHIVAGSTHPVYDQNGQLVTPAFQHSSTNTLFVTRNMQAWVFSISQNKWVKCGSRLTPTGHLDKWPAGGFSYGVSDDFPVGSIRRQNIVCGGNSVIASVIQPYDSECFIMVPIPIPNYDIGNFAVGFEARLGLIDPNGVDDRDLSCFVGSAWFDLHDSKVPNYGDSNRYITQTVTINGQSVESKGGIPFHTFDGGRARQERITNEWRFYTLVGIKTYDQARLALPYSYPVQWTYPALGSLAESEGGFAWSAAKYLANPCPFEPFTATTATPTPTPAPSPVPVSLTRKRWFFIRTDQTSV